MIEQAKFNLKQLAHELSKARYCSDVTRNMIESIFTLSWMVTKLSEIVLKDEIKNLKIDKETISKFIENVKMCHRSDYELEDSEGNFEGYIFLDNLIKKER